MAGHAPEPSPAAPGPQASTGAAAPAASTVLERSALDSILALDDGQGTLLKQVIALYIEAAPPLVEQIRQAWHDGDTPALRMAAHSLKSSSASIGAVRLSDLCRRVEHAAVNADLGDGVPRPEQLHAELAAVLQALQREIPSTS